MEYFLEIDNQKISGKISNVSLSGAYLETMEPQLSVSHISQQGVVNIKTENDWVKIKCNIVYVGAKKEDFPSGAGVEFCMEDEEAATAIWNIVIQYVSQNQSLFAPIKYFFVSIIKAGVAPRTGNVQGACAYC